MDGDDEDWDVGDLETLRGNPAFRQLADMTLADIEMGAVTLETPNTHDQVVSVLASANSARRLLEDFNGGPLPESGAQMLQLLEPIVQDIAQTQRSYEELAGIAREEVPPDTDMNDTDMGPGVLLFTPGERGNLGIPMTDRVYVMQVNVCNTAAAGIGNASSPPITYVA